MFSPYLSQKSTLQWKNKTSNARVSFDCFFFLRIRAETMDSLNIFEEMIHLILSKKVHFPFEPKRPV